jgi:DNA-directed RNA polymerase subunit E'/Rpb7
MTRTDTANYVTITKTVCLSPKYLDKNIQKHLYNHVYKQIINQCDQDNGYITDIDKNITIHENFTSPSNTGGVFFSLGIRINSLKPQIGQQYQGVADTIIPEGVLMQIDGKIKTFIPSTQLNGYTFNKDKTFVNKKKKIKEGDTIKIEIIKVRYENKNFSCIGKLV